jgi:hypothetical protein
MFRLYEDVPTGNITKSFRMLSAGFRSQRPGKEKLSGIVVLCLRACLLRHLGSLLPSLLK